VPDLEKMKTWKAPKAEKGPVGGALAASAAGSDERDQPNKAGLTNEE
jgi:hypothetical protein